MSKQIATARRTVRRCATSGIVSAALSCAIMANPVGAEDISDPQSLVPGLRVRIVAPDIAPGKLVGSILKADTESVTVEVSGRHEPVAVPRDKIMSADISEGPRSRWVDVGIGAGTGLATGAVACAAANSKSKGNLGNLVSGGEIAALCGLIGGGLGALIGAAIPPGERWHRLTASSYRVSVVPRLDHELGLAISMAF
jgi:hypothetical protein